MAFNKELSISNINIDNTQTHDFIQEKSSYLLNRSHASHLHER